MTEIKRAAITIDPDGQITKRSKWAEGLQCERTEKGIYTISPVHGLPDTGWRTSVHYDDSGLPPVVASLAHEGDTLTITTTERESGNPADIEVGLTVRVLVEIEHPEPDEAAEE